MFGVAFFDKKGGGLTIKSKVSTALSYRNESEDGFLKHIKLFKC